MSATLAKWGGRITRFYKDNKVPMLDKDGNQKVREVNGEEVPRYWTLGEMACGIFVRMCLVAKGYTDSDNRKSALYFQSRDMLARDLCKNPEDPKELGKTVHTLKRPFAELLATPLVERVTPARHGRTAVYRLRVAECVAVHYSELARWYTSKEDASELRMMRKLVIGGALEERDNL